MRDAKLDLFLLAEMESAGWVETPPIPVPSQWGEMRAEWVGFLASHAALAPRDLANALQIEYQCGSYRTKSLARRLRVAIRGLESGNA